MVGAARVAAWPVMGVRPEAGLSRCCRWRHPTIARRCLRHYWGARDQRRTWVMDTRIVSAQQLVDDEVRWRDLAANALEPNPALDPDLLGPALTLTHAPADLRFVVVEADGRLEACLPIRPIDRWLRFRRRAFTTRLDGAPVPVLPILAAPLVRAEQGEEAVHAVLASLVAETAQAAIGLLVLERLDEGPVAALISDACRTLRLPTYSYEHW